VDKVYIKGYIPKDLDDRFRAIVAQKFPKFRRSSLSKVLIYAIELYIRTQNTQQQNTRNIQSSKTKSYRIINVWKDCKEFLTKNGYVDAIDIPRGAKIPDTVLKVSIDSVRGTDSRTYGTWVDNFLKHDILKRSGTHQYEVLRDEEYEFEQSVAEDKRKATLELDKIQYKEQLK
jgi:hypothetical protein